ncbi:MAG: GcrA cell cycle regulator [Caulobacter sp.]|nr:GcrA cell cycle regulator [Caulobacter sp.]
MSASTWTDDRIEILGALWREGLSAAQIARRLAGGVTRNAVIGKIHRLGLARRAKPSRLAARRPSRPPRAPSPPRARPVSPARPAASIAREIEGPGLAAVLSIGAHACRWPIGDPKDEGFSLCGRPARRGAFCLAHGALAYRRPDRQHLLKLAGLA